jgi:hypothetical protein
MSTSDYKSNVASGIEAISGENGTFDAQMDAFFSKYPDAEARVTAAEAAEQIVAGFV